MTIVFIGSRAAMHYGIKPYSDGMIDYDVIGTLEDLDQFYKLYEDQIERMYLGGKKCQITLVNGEKIEFELVLKNTSSELIYDYATADNTSSKIYSPLFKVEVVIPSLTLLFKIKDAHIRFPIKFEKNIYYWTQMRESIRTLQIDAATNIVEDAIAKRRNEEVSDRVQRKINLNMDNSEFFNLSEDCIKRVVPHDVLHDLLKYYDTPMYTRIKYDQSKALCNEELFLALTYNDKIRTVVEEAKVIGVERLYLKDASDDAFAIFKYGLRRICTTLTSGWFREFALQNYDRCIKKVSNELDIGYNYLDKVKHLKEKVNGTPTDT